jgi:hypothetical protein
MDHHDELQQSKSGGVSRSRAFTYQSHLPSTQQRAGIQRGRRIAKSLRRIIVTCIAASTFQKKGQVKGTVSWMVEDDQGRSHGIIIPDVPMSTKLPHKLLLPQYWAQETKKISRISLLGSWRPSCNTNASKRWPSLEYRHLHKGLLKLGYKLSKVNSYVYYKGKTVFMLYVDDGIFAEPSKTEIDK